MFDWLRKVLVGPEMTSKEKQVAIQCIEARLGRKVFHLDGPATTQLIKEFGFSVRECDGKRYLN